MKFPQPLAVLSLVFLPFPALQTHGDSSGLTVLGHDRGAVPAESIIGDLLGRFRLDPDSPLPSPIREEPDPVRELRHVGYPVVSDLRPSVASAGVKRIPVPLPLPVCLIGPDAASLRWIAAHRSRLVEMRAQCILVAARDAEEVERVRKAAHPLMVQSVPAGAIARMHGIRTVPALLVGSSQ